MTRSIFAFCGLPSRFTFTARLLATGLLVLLVNLSPIAAMAASVEMLTTSGCSCCHAWARHLRAAGHTVNVKDLAMGQLMRAKLDAGIPANLAACHTARIDQYIIEGHVPVREIQRLLVDRPDVIGLVVAGMPIGSPGMESGNRRDAYEVLLLKRDGTTEIYERYPASQR